MPKVQGRGPQYSEHSVKAAIKELFAKEEEHMSIEQFEDGAGI